MITRDEIIALAIKAGLGDWFWLNPGDPDFPDEMKVIEAFFHAAQRQAYERAAQACIEACCNDLTDAEVVAAIRALIEGETK